MSERSISEVIGELRFIAHDLRVLSSEATDPNTQGVFSNVSCDLDDAADELEDTQ